jgi:hypothetical protein
MVDFEKRLTPDTVLKRLKPVCSQCGLGIRIRKITEFQDQQDFQIEIDPCPVCQKAAETRSDWTREQEPHLQELIDYALKSKRILFGRPLEKLSPAEVMAALGFMIRESERADEVFDKLLPPY